MIRASPSYGKSSRNKIAQVDNSESSLVYCRGTQLDVSRQELVD